VSRPRKPDGLTGHALSAVYRADTDPRLVGLVRWIRSRLPGDHHFGDALSTTGTREFAVAGRQLRRATAGQPGVLGEVGFAILQVWQALAASAGTTPDDETELTLAFTDLVGFSEWALEAGDERAVRLLREVSHAVEGSVMRHNGIVVKWLGDGMMAVFADASEAMQAMCEAQQEVATIRSADYRPRMRAGLHTGRPRRLGSDYLGVDVNIAARVAERASAGELLVSETTLDALDGADVAVRRRRTLLPVKGVPGGMKLYSVEAA
jgi:adenylate cyclase